MSENNGISGTIGMGVILDRREGPFLIIQDDGASVAIEVTRVVSIGVNEQVRIGNEQSNRPAVVMMLDGGGPVAIPVASRSVLQLTIAIAAARKQWDAETRDLNTEASTKTIANGTIQATETLNARSKEASDALKSKLLEAVANGNVCPRCMCDTGITSTPIAGSPLAGGPLGSPHNPHLDELEAAEREAAEAQAEVDEAASRDLGVTAATSKIPSRAERVKPASGPAAGTN